MGPAYSNNWACSAVDREGGSCLDDKYVRSWCAAALYILRCSASARIKALRWVVKSSSTLCRAREVYATCALPRASMCRTCRVARTRMALAACRRASAIMLACAVACCKINRLSCTKVCNRHRPPIAAFSRPRLPAASAARTKLTSKATLRWLPPRTSLSLCSHSRDSCPATVLGLWLPPVAASGPNTTAWPNQIYRRFPAVCKPDFLVPA